ncbi:helix-turn-helix domain-containing protein [Halobaculum marinum]|uniref:Helix-turn-helix domain-containing protein n=1 Tax=Halobaculum marinum TaxID=3031996 RepID=A0ABD5WXR2_9EURY|nr:helix-turn-helix domain-containing protein [Halobaculum sp. DT55]
MLIAVFTIQHPVLGGALRAVPSAEASWEETYSSDDVLTQMLFWVTCEEASDFDAFEEAVGETSAVRNLVEFAEVDDRRLYRVDFTEEGRRTNLMSEFIGVGAVLQSATGTADGWRCRVRFPDREGYRRLFEVCEAHDIPFRFERIYEQTSVDADGGSTLTDPQRETLLAAVESGYLDIPRAVSLAELGERLGVSQRSASERFRRGVKKLIREHL